MGELEKQGGGSVVQTGAATPAAREGTTSTAPRPRLKSEDVIINAPMSFAGAFQRTMRLRRVGGLNQKPWFVQALWVALVLYPILIVWWMAIIGWYVVFGIFLFPYRLLRRGARKRKAEALRHREMLGAIDKSQRD